MLTILFLFQQGVDLTNIIKDLILSGKPDNHIVAVTIRNISKLMSEDTLDKEQLIKDLEVLKVSIYSIIVDL